MELSSSADEKLHRRLAGSAPAAVADKVRSSLITGERRPVTALFADVVGSTAIMERLDPEIWTGLLNQAFELMAQAVYRYEGTIAHLLGDGLLAFFGSPIAHEDDPERAVRAALEMLDVLAPFSRGLSPEIGVDFRIRVGVNTGTVVVGDIGSDLRYQFTAIGDAVNVAARLQGEAAPGTVLVAGPTYRFIAPRFETRAVGALTLKGKAEPVAAYQVLGIKSTPGQTRGLTGLTSTLVGRAVPLAELEEMLEAATAGRGGAAVLVLGEPGIGKSRLLRELKARLDEDRAAGWAEGQCLSYGRGMAYHLLLDLLRSLLGLGASTDPASVETALSARLDGMEAAARAEAYRFLARLLGLPLSEADAAGIQALAEEVRHERLVAAVGTLISCSSGAGARVLVCEDVHWADRSSTEVLRDMLGVVADLPLLLLLTSRPEPDAPIDELAGAAARALGDRFRKIHLAPLTQPESSSLVAQLLEIEKLPQDTRKLILEKSEGNPLFVEEIIRMLMERDAIVRQADKWVARAPANWGELPTTLNGLLLARVDRLPEEPKHLARVAAVMGRQFDLRSLSAVLEVANGRIDVERSIEDLVAFDLLEPADAGGAAYSFRHALIEDAVYESILHRDRSRLHGAVAGVLERLHADRVDEWAAEIARHLERAGEVGRSVDYLMMAAENALQRFARREALDLFERALKHLSSMPGKTEVLRKRVKAGLGWTDAGMTFVPGHQQLAQLEGLLPDAQELGDPLLLAEVYLAIAEIRHEMGEIPRVSAPLAEAVAEVERIAESLSDERLKAFPIALRGLSHFAGSEYRQAIGFLQEAVPLLERHSSATKAAYYSGMVAIAAARLGQFDLADRWLGRAQALADRSQDPSALMDVDLHRGFVEGEKGNLAEALGFARRGTETAVRIDNKACALVGYFIMGDQQMKLGLREQAQRSLESSIDIAEFCNVADIANLSQAWLSAVRAQLGDEQQVLPRLDTSLARAREMGDRLSEGEILRQRAIVRARTAAPAWESVKADFEDAIAIFEQIEAAPYVARALRDYGLTLEAGGRIGEGQEKLSRALKLFESLRMNMGDAELVATAETRPGLSGDDSGE
ncbi:MAG TPA: adenylate/guanylate cyclase domain-containing protein [Actinomycetota bacterium]|nr:adenylate/guanylate cyclase domain-containing protein [Actinomycetota bacterium]